MRVIFIQPNFFSGIKRRAPYSVCMRTILLVFLVSTLNLPVMAEVIRSEETAFEININLEISADPGSVYNQLIQPQNWWNPDHSYSGLGENFYMTPVAGGCFCENLPGSGMVVHMSVLYAAPGKMLRLGGGLGPLQEYPVNGVMSWALEPVTENTTKLTLTYLVSGNVEGGLTSWADAVGGVLVEATDRLKAQVESLPK